MGKLVLILCLSAVLIAITHAASTYTTQFDNIDIDAILRNERVYKKYFDCLANRGKCTPDGKELKDKLPDALKTSCSKCSSKQKQGLEKVIKYLIKNKPQDFQLLSKMYDPSGEFKRRYSEEAKKRGIKL